MIFPCVKCKIHNEKIHKYANTAYHKVPERPKMWYIFEKRIVQGYQKLYSHVPNAQIQKYKYTNRQKQHITKCQKDPTCGIFLKRGFSESSMYHLYIVSAPSVHHQRIISASSAHHQRIISASLLCVLS